MSDNLLSTSWPCANFAKIYPLSKMICHHSKNRLKIQKQCHYFSVSEKVPVLNNRSRALLAYHNHLSVGCWRAAASCEPQSKQRNQALSWTSGPVTNLTASNTKRERYFRRKGSMAWKSSVYSTIPTRFNSQKISDQMRRNKMALHKNVEIGVHPVAPFPLSSHSKSGQVQVLTQCV